MTISDVQVNTPVTTVLVNTVNLANPSVALYLGGVLQSTTVTTTNLSSGVWSITFTPTAAGNYTVVGWGAVQLRVSVVTKSLYSFLSNIEDEALGSWSWDKTTGVLTMVRQNGAALATFNVVDTLTLSSRERV